MPPLLWERCAAPGCWVVIVTSPPTSFRLLDGSMWLKESLSRPPTPRAMGRCTTFSSCQRGSRHQLLVSCALRMWGSSYIRHRGFCYAEMLRGIWSGHWCATKGPMPLLCTDQCVPALDTEEQVAKATVRWYSAARGEAASLLLQAEKSRQVHFKWTAAPGPLANLICDATSGSVQWSSAQRLQESATSILGGHSHRVVERHHAALARLCKHSTRV